MNPIIVIPARMASDRLPGKPLEDICGVPMIVHVWRRAREAGVGPAVVACADKQIFDAVRDAGGEAVMTEMDHASGTDRIFEAVNALDADGAYDAVINVQGDLPTIEPGAIHAALDPLEDPGVDIATLVAEITDPGEIDDPNVVKAAVAMKEGGTSGRALYFSRNPVPWGEGALYHHIGLYAYRRDALKRFVHLDVGVLERREKLEQLRALEAGMRIDAVRVDTIPLGVDTPADLKKARALLAP